MEDVRAFLVAVVKKWKPLVASLGGVVASVWATLNPQYPLPSWLGWVVAGIGGVVASFQVWKDEHDKTADRPSPRLELATEGAWLLLKVQSDVQAEYWGHVLAERKTFVGHDKGRMVW